MSNPLPALTRPYFTRANQPFSSTASQALIEAFWIWALSANLMNLSTLGSTGGTRASTSIWIARGASPGDGTFSAVTAAGVANSTAAAMWGGGTFNSTKIVRGAAGANHSWMLLENVNLGYELMINCGATVANLSIMVGKTGTFTVGSGTATAYPTTAGGGLPFALNGTTLDTEGAPFAMFGGTGTVGSFSDYFHFVCADSGEFYCMRNRSATGFGFNSFVSVWKTVGQPTGDTNNCFLLCSDSTANGRGAPAVLRMAASMFCSGRLSTGVYASGGGIALPTSSVGNLVGGTPVDQNTGLINTAPCDVIHLVSGPYRRGTLPDWYLAGAGPLGYSIPDVATQIRTQVGDLILPFTAIAPAM